MEPIEQVRRWANKAFREYVPLRFEVASLSISPTDNEGVYQLDLVVYSPRTGVRVTIVATFTHAEFLANRQKLVDETYTMFIAQLLKDGFKKMKGPLQ